MAQLLARIRVPVELRRRPSGQRWVEILGLRHYGAPYVAYLSESGRCLVDFRDGSRLVAERSSSA